MASCGGATCGGNVTDGATCGETCGVNVTDGATCGETCGVNVTCGETCGAIETAAYFVCGIDFAAYFI